MNFTNITSMPLTQCLQSGDVVGYYAYQGLWMIILPLLIAAFDYLGLSENPKIIKYKQSLKLVAIIFLMAFLIFSYISINQSIKILNT